MKPSLTPFHTERENAKRISHVMLRWNKPIASYGCFHIDLEHSHTENVNVFFSSSPTNLLSFVKWKHGPSNKIWALQHHMTRATAVTQKINAVVLKAQTVLSTSVNTVKITDHNRKLLQALDDDLKWVLSKNVNNYINFQYSLMLIVPLIISDVL